MAFWVCLGRDVKEVDLEPNTARLLFWIEK